MNSEVYFRRLFPLIAFPFMHRSSPKNARREVDQLVHVKGWNLRSGV